MMSRAFPSPSLQGSQVLAATYNQAAQLWKVGETQSKVRPSWGGCLRVKGLLLKICRVVIWGAWINVCFLWGQETLSGHKDKVTAAKFKLTRHQAVTGSRDRTVKEWDLGRAYCEAQSHLPPALSHRGPYLAMLW